MILTYIVVSETSIDALGKNKENLLVKKGSWVH